MQRRGKKKEEAMEQIKQKGALMKASAKRMAKKEEAKGNEKEAKGGYWQEYHVYRGGAWEPVVGWVQEQGAR